MAEPLQMQDENNAVNDVIGVLSAVDANTSDTHTYSLVTGTGNTDNDSFSISGSDLVADEVLTSKPKQVIQHIKQQYPELKATVTPPHSTSKSYFIPGFKGKTGVIAAYSRTFCHDCNRIRITAKDTLKNCLYDNGVFDLKAKIREGYSDEQLKAELTKVFQQRPKDGFEAAKSRKNSYESMTTIGG